MKRKGLILGESEIVALGRICWKQKVWPHALRGAKIRKKMKNDFFFIFLQSKTPYTNKILTNKMINLETFLKLQLAYPPRINNFFLFNYNKNNKLLKANKLRYSLNIEL